MKYGIGTPKRLGDESNVMVEVFYSYRSRKISVNGVPDESHLNYPRGWMCMGLEPGVCGRIGAIMVEPTLLVSKHGMDIYHFTNDKNNLILNV